MKRFKHGLTDLGAVVAIGTAVVVVLKLLVRM